MMSCTILSFNAHCCLSHCPLSCNRDIRISQCSSKHTRRKKPDTWNLFASPERHGTLKSKRKSSCWQAPAIGNGRAQQYQPMVPGSRRSQLYSPLKVMGVRMAAGEPFLQQKEVFLTPHLQHKPPHTHHTRRIKKKHVGGKWNPFITAEKLSLGKNWT